MSWSVAAVYTGVVGRGEGSVGKEIFRKSFKDVLVG